MMDAIRILFSLLFVLLPFVFAAALSRELAKERGSLFGWYLLFPTIAALVINCVWGYLGYRAAIAEQKWTAASLSLVAIVPRSVLIVGLCWYLRRTLGRHADGQNDRQALINVLSEARELLGRPDNDFSWSSWTGANEATQEIDGLIASIEAGNLPDRSSIDVLCLPTGPICEVSVSSGWGKEYLELAERMDSAVGRVYGRAPG